MCRKSWDSFLLLTLTSKSSLQRCKYAITSFASSAIRLRAPRSPSLTPNAMKVGSASSHKEGNLAMAAKTNHNHRNSEPPFEPCFLFFYGSLMDTEVLQTIARLPEVPAVQEGSVTGFEMKMWGIYPTLIPCAGGQVSGTAWKVNEPGPFFRLQNYETSAYTWCSCEIRLSNGEILRGCRTFCWAGDVNSIDLKEGKFDLKHYQKYFKASVVRKAPSRRLVWE